MKRQSKRNIYKGCFLFFLNFIITSSLSAQVKTTGALLNNLKNEFDTDISLSGSTYSYCIIDAQSGELIAEHNSKLAMIPASTLKIVTTSAALGILGKDFRYETQIGICGKFDSISGIINGDVIIKGSGDPTLNSEAIDTKLLPQKLQQDWAQQFKKAGIKTINGNIIADNSCFDSNLPDNWIWADIGNYFGAGANGLSYRDNKIKLYFNTGSKQGDSTFIISSAPKQQELQILNKVVTGGKSDNTISYGAPKQNLRIIYGTLPPNKTNFEVEISMPDPAYQCAYEFFLALKEIGIKINGQARVSETPVQINRIVHKQFSVSLDKIIQQTNFTSNNLYAESLLKTISFKKTGYGSIKEGVSCILDFWRERGLPIQEIFMSDGSGLSRSNTLSTSFLTKLLCKIFRDPQLYGIINSSFPVAGKSGSLSGLCKGTFAENNLRAKSGYINRARGYAGYVKNKNGKELAFTVLFNNYNCSATEAKLKIEKILTILPENQGN